MEWLEDQARTIHQGGEAASLTVRDLLSKFGADRRGKHIVTAIREQLDAAGLTTWPSFVDSYIDGQIELRGQQQSVARNIPDRDHDPDEGGSDPVPRIAQLKAANQPLVKVCRDATIEEAKTLMMLHDFSQLPVMQGDRAPVDFIGWKTIGAARAQGKTLQFVRDAMDRPEVVMADVPLFDAVERIARHDFVLVEGAGRRISGLVTNYDVSVEFHRLSRPFLLISQIEGHLRELIQSRFSLPELAAARDPDDSERAIESVADLTFGEYLRLLQQEDMWSKLNIGLDRVTMMKRLDRVREIRNDIMHFNPDPLSDEDLRLLSGTSHCLAGLAG